MRAVCPCSQDSSVSARKPTIAPNMSCQSYLSTEPSEQLEPMFWSTHYKRMYESEEQANNNPTKYTPYNIDYIINSLDCKNNTETINETEIHAEESDRDANSLGTYDERENCTPINLTVTKYGIVDSKNSSFVSKPRTDSKFYEEAYTFVDKSSEVKHAETPMSYVPNPQTCSPQLPLPSPNYPVQARSAAENSCHNTNGFLNNLVPTTNNNDISTPQPTSHTDLNLLDHIGHSASDLSVHKASVKSNKQLTNLNPSERRNTKAIKRLQMKPRTYRKSTINIERNLTLLNIPTYQGPSTKLPQLSKIDLAMQKKKLRKRQSAPKVREQKPFNNNDRITKDFGVTVIGYSDSSSSSWCSSSLDSDEGDREVDLCIRSGPPSKPNMSSDKLNFLKLFKLTTHSMRDSLELYKLKKRKWITPGIVCEEFNTNVLSLDLPVPCKSPSLLNTLPSVKTKRNFMHLLGLRNVSTEDRKEMERNWIHIVKERLRRNCECPLTKYSLKVFDSIKATNNGNGLVHPVISNSLDTSFKIPVVQQYNTQTYLPIHNQDFHRNFSITKEIATGYFQNSCNKLSADKKLDSSDVPKIRNNLYMPKSIGSYYVRDCYNVVTTPKVVESKYVPQDLNNLSTTKNFEYVIKNDSSSLSASKTIGSSYIPENVNNSISRNIESAFVQNCIKLSKTETREHCSNPSTAKKFNSSYVYDNGNNLSSPNTIVNYTISKDVPDSYNNLSTTKKIDIDYGQESCIKIPKAKNFEFKYLQENCITYPRCQNFDINVQERSNNLSKTNIEQSSCNKVVPRKNIESNYVPLTMVIIGNQNFGMPLLNNVKSKEAEECHESKVNENLKWPGIEEIEKSYKNYAKEQTEEIEQLKKKASVLNDKVKNYQHELKYWERKQRELHSVIFMNAQRGKQWQTSIDKLTNIISAFR